MRPKSTASSNRTSPAKPDAIARTSQGIATCARSVNTIRTEASPENASRAKSSGSSSASSFLENIGTKAVLNAPSAKKRRNMLGRAKATKNASDTGPTPMKAAIRMSRTKPKTRLPRVQNPTVTNPESSRIGRAAPVMSGPRPFRDPRNRVAQFAFQAFLPGLGVQLQAEHVLYIEGVDHLRAIGRDHR